MFLRCLPTFCYTHFGKKYNLFLNCVLSLSISKNDTLITEFTVVHTYFKLFQQPWLNNALFAMSRLIRNTQHEQGWPWASQKFKHLETNKQDSFWYDLLDHIRLKKRFISEWQLQFRFLTHYRRVREGEPNHVTIQKLQRDDAQIFAGALALMETSII